MPKTATIIPAAEPAPDLVHPALAPYLAALPPDDALARLAGELTGAWAAVAAERERGAGLRRRRSAIGATLGTATGDARTAALRDLVLADADLATVPAALADATRRYALARLGWLARVLALAEAERRETIARTNDSIVAAGRARLALDRATGCFGDRQASPEKIAELRAEAARLGAAVAPDVERHRRATEAAGMVRAMVHAAYGDHVAGFDRTDRSHVPWDRVAARAGEDAAERARRETTG